MLPNTTGLPHYLSFQVKRNCAGGFAVHLKSKKDIAAIAGRCRLNSETDQGENGKGATVRFQHKWNFQLLILNKSLVLKTSA